MKIDFTGVDIPFTAADLLAAGAGLLGVVGLFVLLGMSFRVAPKLIDTIFAAFK